MLGSLKSLVNLEQKHEMVTVIRIESGSSGYIWAYYKLNKICWKTERSDRSGNQPQASKVKRTINSLEFDS